MSQPAVERTYHERIRIGTLVNGLGKIPPERWISQILPHGFESFGSITGSLGPCRQLTALVKITGSEGTAIPDSAAWSRKLSPTAMNLPQPR